MFQKITNYLKQFKFVIIISCIIILFPDSIIKFYEDYYEKYIVKVLLHFYRSLLSDVILALFVGYLIFWTYIKLKIKFYLKNIYVIYSLLLTVLYTIARIYFKDQLLETYSIDFIKYSDSIYIILTIPIILKFSICIKKLASDQNNTVFLSDEPIKKLEDDILNRKNMTAQVVRLIKMYNPKSSLAIGIVGNWGYGKTSFMNIVESSFIDDNKYITIHFNSWLNISINSIINDFFDTIEKEISKHSIDASKEFKKYGNQVLSVNKTQITEVISNLLNIIPNKSLSESFEELNTLLNEIDKKVIVFFDDLDRLQPNEVFEVLKLIRNTASFDIFTYIVGYDKPYLIKSLEYNLIPFPEKYCEKIFVKEFQLPPITQSNIIEYVKNSLLIYFPKKQTEILEAFANVTILTEIDAEINIFKSINNIRNAKRFIYEFFIGIDKIIDEVKLSEFLLIKLLKFSYYDTYLLLFNKDAYFENNENAYSGEMKYVHYRLKMLKNNRNTLRDTFENTYLYNDLTQLDIYDKSQLKNIENICNQLFHLYNNHNINPLSIMYGSNYFKYFEDEISEINYSIKDFEKFMKSDFNNQRKIINQLETENKLSGLVLFLYKVNIFNEIPSKYHYENFIKSLFYIGSLKLETSYNKYRGFNFETISTATNNSDNSIVRKFGYNSVNELKEFINDILYQEKENYYFEIDYVRFLCEHISLPHVILNKDEIRNFLIFCFNHYSKKISSIDENFSTCYRLCFLTEYEGWTKIKIILETNKEKLIYNIIPNILDEFLLKCIVLHEDENYVNEYTGKVSLPNHDPIRIFGTQADFIEYLESDKLLQNLSKPSEFLTEFILFAKKAVSQKKFIDFNFSYPPAIEKISKALTQQ